MTQSRDLLQNRRSHKMRTFGIEAYSVNEYRRHKKENVIDARFGYILPRTLASVYVCIDTKLSLKAVREI